MKKITKFAVAAVLALTMMFTIAACTQPTPTPDPTPEKGYKVGTAYGIVYKSYLGIITVTTDKKDKVTNVSIDEAFFPSNWAKQETNEVFGGDLLATSFAKFISIDGKLFTGVESEDKKTVEYKSGEIEAVKYITDNSASYVDAIKAGKVFIAKADGSFLATANVGGSMFKSSAAYWAGTGLLPNPGKDPAYKATKGWASNMQDLSSYFVKNGFNFTDADIKDPTSSGTPAVKVPGMIGDVSTGASLTSFSDYVKLAKKAFDARA